MFNEIRDVSRLAATTLHSLVDSQFTDIMLMLINEEMKRYEGRKWKVQFPKLLGNKLLLFPTAVTMMSASLTSSSFSSSLGIDFSIPISQIESLRKNIQLFLLIRALFHSMNQRINKEGGGSNNNDEVVYISDDFCSNGFIDDRTFLCLEESNLIPAIYQVNNEGNSNSTNSKSATTTGNSKGGLFDMKGKKFLDCSTSLASTLTNSPSSTSTVSTSDLMSDDSSTSSSSSIWSTSASVLSMGLIGGNKKAANIVSTKPINSPSNPRKQSLTGKGGNSTNSNNGELKLLFVQDPMLLILVTQSRVDGKSVFKIFLIVPLLYCDAKIDLNNKCKFKLVVRSWKNQVNMTKHESEFMIEGVNNNGNGNGSASENGNNNGKGLFGFGNGNNSHNNAQRRGVETFLKNVEKSSLYYLNICMETEQACSLAVQHIESRRKLLTNHKLDKLKNILNAWMDEAPVPSE